MRHTFGGRPYERGSPSETKFAEGFTNFVIQTFEMSDYIVLCQLGLFDRFSCHGIERLLS